MPQTKPKKGTCQICKKTFNFDELPLGEVVRSSIVKVIKENYPQWQKNGHICYTDLNNFRLQYTEDMLKKEKGELTKIEHDVLKSLKEQELLSKNIFKEFDRRIGFGDRLADRVAIFGGSWKFIILFFVIVLAWIVLNSYFFIFKPFDPYPFILLNLVLSCIAAVQAPIIIMSQNRIEARDRLRSEHDYKINLKAEIEIQNLHEKLDHLIMNQWQRLLEIQQIQIELIEELIEKYRNNKR